MQDDADLPPPPDPATAALSPKPAVSFADFCKYGGLLETWRALREDLSQAPGRDCIDFLDIDMGRERWIQRIRSRITSGQYRPKPPGRKEAAKTQGTFRIITVPSIDDLLVYRHLAELLLKLARPKERPGTFFSRRFQREPVGKKIDSADEDTYLNFFEIWIRYNNYRQYIGLNSIYQFLVVTDIAAYFDSIEHSLLLEYIAPFGLPREALGILGQLLETLRPETGHSPAPAVGLPVDVYDCSRILAHTFLFEHDDRVLEMAAEDSYVRFMDDQAIGVLTEAEGRETIRNLQLSLNRQRLTLNSSKTKILSQTELVKQYCLDENGLVDALDELLKQKADDGPIAAAFGVALASMRDARSIGQWAKVAERLYRLGAQIGSDEITIEDCKSELVMAPPMAKYVFRYLIARERFDDHLQLFSWLLDEQHSLYEDVEEEWFESMLVACPPDAIRQGYVDMAWEFAKGTSRGCCRRGSRVPATLLLYWLAPLTTATMLEAILNSDPDFDAERQRTAAACLCALQPGQVDRWLSLAAREPAPHISNLIDWLARLRGNETLVVPNPIVRQKRPLNVGPFVYDARACLKLELLTQSTAAEVRIPVAKFAKRLLATDRLPTERVVGERLAMRLGLA